MNQKDELNERLKETTVFLNDIMNQLVTCNFIFIYDNKVILKNIDRSFPTINILKKDLHEDIITAKINKELNVPISKVNILPFETTNDSDIRIYKIKISPNDFININDKYEFYLIDSIDNEYVLSILENLFK